jgi:hypothetical protein
MARPNVSIRVLDESLVVPTSEEGSPTIGAMVSVKGLSLFGTTAEKAQGYYLVTDIPDWFARLNTFTNVENNLNGGSGLTFSSAYLATAGATVWTEEWYSVYNFLQYGAPCYVGFNNNASGLSGFYSLTPDVIFEGVTAASAITKTFFNHRSSQQSPAFGVFIAAPEYISNLDATNLGTINANIGGLSEPSLGCFVYGQKNQLNASGNTTTSLIPTSMAADVAGCLARTDRVSYPWYSPAGVRRGQILNVVSLVKNLTETQQDNLYDNKINPVVTFTGEGTILFGDRTFDSITSSLSSINVARLVIYLKKTLAPLARGILFEQNDALTRNRFANAADSVLREVQDQKGISDYKVICDESNNTSEVIEAKQFVADILIKPIPSVNFVKITITNKDLSDTL